MQDTNNKHKHGVDSNTEVNKSNNSYKLTKEQKRFEKWIADGRPRVIWDSQKDGTFIKSNKEHVEKMKNNRKQFNELWDKRDEIIANALKEQKKHKHEY